MAAITDKFGKASIDTDYAIATTVKTTRVPGATVLEAFDLSKFSDDTPVFFVTYKKTTDPVTDITTVSNLISWKGLVNVGANTITNLTLAPGYTDTGNAIGDFIECIPTSHWVNSLVEGIFVAHNPDGTLKDKIVTLPKINGGSTAGTLATDASGNVTSVGVWSAFSGGVGSTAGSLSDAGLVGSFTTLGKIVHYRATITIVNNGTASGALSFSLPSTSKVSTLGMSIGSGRENATSGNMVVVTLSSATQGLVRTYNNTYPASSGSIIHISGTYEAA